MRVFGKNVFAMAPPAVIKTQRPRRKTHDRRGPSFQTDKGPTRILMTLRLLNLKIPAWLMSSRAVDHYLVRANGHSQIESIGGASVRMPVPVSRNSRRPNDQFADADEAVVKDHVRARLWLESRRRGRKDDRVSGYSVRRYCEGKGKSEKSKSKDEKGARIFRSPIRSGFTAENGSGGTGRKTFRIVGVINTEIKEGAAGRTPWIAS